MVGVLASAPDTVLVIGAVELVGVVDLVLGEVLGPLVHEQARGPPAELGIGLGAAHNLVARLLDLQRKLGHRDGVEGLELARELRQKVHPADTQLLQAGHEVELAEVDAVAELGHRLAEGANVNVAVADAAEVAKVDLGANVAQVQLADHVLQAVVLGLVHLAEVERLAVRRQRLGQSVKETGGVAVVARTIALQVVGDAADKVAQARDTALGELAEEVVQRRALDVARDAVDNVRDTVLDVSEEVTDRVEETAVVEVGVGTLDHVMMSLEVARHVREGVRARGKCHSGSKSEAHYRSVQTSVGALAMA